ncbi:hypothetical protein M8J76_002310 [Diaphorina citri]|nr:hypothetical protein M8J76_002310 [Diaphorina citri]
MPGVPTLSLVWLPCPPSCWLYPPHVGHSCCYWTFYPVAALRLQLIASGRNSSGSGNCASSVAASIMETR